MNRTTIKSPPLSPPGQGQPDGAVPPQPRPATCAEDGCDAPATTWVCVPVSGPRGDPMDPQRMPYCAPCSQKPGLEISDADIAPEQWREKYGPDTDYIAATQDALE